MSRGSPHLAPTAVATTPEEIIAGLSGEGRATCSPRQAPRLTHVGHGTL